MGHFVETRRPTNMKYLVAVALALAAVAVAEPEASAEPGYSYYGYRYPHYNYGYGHLGHPYGLGHYGYRHRGYYGKRSAESQQSAGLPGALPYLHYDLGRKLGYFAYRGYPQGPAVVHAHPAHKRSADADPGHYGYYGYVNYGHQGYYGYPCLLRPRPLRALLRPRPLPLRQAGRRRRGRGRGRRLQLLRLRVPLQVRLRIPLRLRSSWVLRIPRPKRDDLIKVSALSVMHPK